MKHQTENINFRRVSEDDREWVKSFTIMHWGSEKVVVHNIIYYPHELEGFIALYKSEKSGLITFIIEQQSCEIVTLNSIVENKGIGSSLVKLVLEETKRNNCNKLWLITSNDNIRAISFYQKLGFQLMKVYPDAVTESRKIKPEIPLIAENGIPIRDELEFVLYLSK
jgi:RimJ/RimL family protein N-acetyltransferase